MGYRELMRRRLLDELYDKMSDEEKRTFIMMTMEDKSREQILDALNTQGKHIENISRKVEKQNWYVNFGSDIAANALWDGILILLRRIVKF